MKMSLKSRNFIWFFIVFVCIPAVFVFLKQIENYNQNAVIQNAKIFQAEGAVVGRPVKWAVVVDTKDITKDKHLVEIPKFAGDVSIKAVTRKEAEEFQNIKILELSLEDKKSLVLDPIPSPSSFVKMLFAQAESAVSSVADSVTSPSGDSQVVDVAPVAEQVASDTEPVSETTGQDEAEEPVSQEEVFQEEIVPTEVPVISESPIIDITPVPTPEVDEKKKEFIVVEYTTENIEIKEKKTKTGKIVTVFVPDEISIKINPTSTPEPLIEASPESTPIIESSPMPESTPEPTVAPLEETQPDPEVPAEPEAPAVPEVPSAPEVPSVPEAPAVPEAPSVPEAPAVPEAPSVPEAPAPGASLPMLLSQAEDIILPTLEPIIEISPEAIPELILESTPEPTPEISPSPEPTPEISPSPVSDKPSIKNILAHTTLPETYKMGQKDKIRVIWRNNNNQEMEFKTEDLDSNGYLDYIEWNIPHLSEQIFEIIFISKAWELDENKEIIDDIYDLAVSQDDKWVKVQSGHYVRATFSQILNNTKDNTIYAKPTKPGQSVTIEVYPVYIDSSGNYTEGNLVATFPVIDQEGKYKVLLTDLQAPTDVFDFKINGDVDIDWIVDPSYSCQSAATGNWSAAATWTNCNSTTPQAEDTVEIMNGHTVTMDNSYTVAGVTVDSGGTLNTSASKTLTVNGNFTNNGSYTAGSSSSTVINGNLTVSAGTFSTYNASSTTGLDVNGNVQVTAGTLSATASTGNTAFTVSGTWEVSGTGKFTPNGGKVVFDGTGTGKTIITNSSDTDDFYRVLFNAASNSWTLSDDLTATDNLVTSAGTLVDNGVTVTVNGTITIGNSSTLTSTGIWIQGASGSIANAIFGNNFRNLQICGAGVTTTFSSDVYVGSTSAAGTLTMGTGTLVGAGYYLRAYSAGNDPFTIGAFTVSSSLGQLWLAIYTNNVTQKAFTLPNNMITSSGDFVLRTSGVNLTATGNWNLGNNNLSFDQNTTLTPTKYIDMASYSLTAGAVKFASNLLNYNGYLKLGSSNSHSIASLAKGTSSGNGHILDLGSSTTAVTGNFDLTGVATFTAGTSTVDFTGTGSQTLTSNSKSFYNIIHSGSGTLVLADNFAISNGGTLTNSNGNFDTETNSKNVTIGTSGTTSAFAFSGGTWEGDGGSGTITVWGSATLSSGTFKQGSGTMTIKNNFANSGTAFTQGTGTITVVGNETFSGTGTFTKNASGLTIFASGTANQQLTSNSVDLGNIQVSANTTNTTLTLQDALNADNITIESSQTLDVKNGSNYAISCGGNWSNSGIFTAQNGTVTFDGDASGKTINASSSAFSTITINSPAGTGYWTLTTNNLSAATMNVTKGTLDVGAGKTITVTGTLTVNGGNISATSQDIGITANAITHTSGAISTTTSGNITLNSSGAPGAFALGDITSAGSLTVGNTTAPATMTLGTISTANAQTYTATTSTTLNSSLHLTTLGTIGFTGPILLATGAIEIHNQGTLDTDDITFSATSTINGAQALSLQTTTAGDIAFSNGAVIGGVTPLTSLTIVGSDTTSIYNVTTTGAQSYTATTSTTLNGTLDLNTAGAIAFTGPVLLGNSLTITNNGTADTDDITFSATSTINGAKDLIVGINTGGLGDVVFSADIGASTPLISLSVDGCDTATVKAVTTTGFQSYDANTSVTLNGTLTVGGDFTIIGGVFNAGANNINVAGNWTNSGTFTAGSGTVTFNGSASQAITPNNSNFYNVTLSNNTFTLAGNTTVGNNLVISEAKTPVITANTNQTFTVTGTTDGTNGGAVETLTVNTTGAVTFTGAVGTGDTDMLTALTITNSAALNFNAAVNITGDLVQTNAATGITTFSNTVAAASATLKGTAYTVSNSLTTTGAVAVTNSGTFTKGATGAIVAPGGFSTSGNVDLSNNITTTNTALSIGGNLVVGEAATPTLAAGNSTIGITGTTDGTNGGAVETLTVNTTGAVTFTGAVGTGDTDMLTALTITNSAALNFNAAVNITGDLVQTNAATGITTFSNTLNAGSVTFRGTTINLGGIATITGNVTIAQGTLDVTAGNFAINIAGNWSNSGSFTARAGTVTFNGANQKVFGATTFYNLTKDVSAGVADTVMFEHTNTQAIAAGGTLTLKGALASILTLRACNNAGVEVDVVGTRWGLNADNTATIAVDYVDVKHSDASAGKAISQTNSTDSGDNLNWTFDIIPPVLSNGNPTGTLDWHTVSATISLTTDENATCRYSLTAGTAYDLMTSTFSTTGTTTHSSSIAGLSAGNSYVYYARCSDAYGNKNASDYAISFAIDNYPPKGGEGGGGSYQPSPTPLITPTPEPEKGIIEKILGPKPLPTPIVELPPIEIPEQAPLSMSGTIKLISEKKLSDFVFAPLPSELMSFTSKMPEFGNILNQLGVNSMSDATALNNYNISIPGLGQAIGLPVGVSLSANNFTSEEKQKIPTDILFVQVGKSNIDVPANISLNTQGFVDEKINVVANKRITLTIKPEYPADSVLGYVLFKSSKVSKQKDMLSFVLAMINPLGEKQTVEEELVTEQFEYEDVDNDGIYTAEINSPVTEGSYDIMTVITYKDKKLGNKVMRLLTVVDPEGYVYEKIGKGELRIDGVRVSIYWLNNGNFELWPASKYGQINPQITDKTGKYSFLVPEGKYYIEAEKNDYKKYKGEEFDVRGGSGVHFNIELKGGLIARIVDWKTLVAIFSSLGFIILAILIFFRNKIIIIKNK